MPPKKAKKPRAKRAPKKGLKQKQKQRQVVNVQVSSGGSGGGGTQFIPMQQAPQFDYSLLASLIRPANTVDVPIRAMAPMAESIAVRPAEPILLAESKKPFDMSNLYVGGFNTEPEEPVKIKRASRTTEEKERRRQTDNARKVREAEEVERNVRAGFGAPIQATVVSGGLFGEK